MLRYPKLREQSRSPKQNHPRVPSELVIEIQARIPFFFDRLAVYVCMCTYIFVTTAYACGLVGDNSQVQPSRKYCSLQVQLTLGEKVIATKPSSLLGECAASALYCIPYYGGQKLSSRSSFAEVKVNRLYGLLTTICRKHAHSVLEHCNSPFAR